MTVVIAFFGIESRLWINVCHCKKGGCGLRVSLQGRVTVCKVCHGKKGGCVRCVISRKGDCV